MTAAREPVGRRSRPDPSLKDFVLEQLETLGETRAQRMFGGWGLYCDEVFFAIVWGGRVYFKTDAASRPRYEALGSKPFRPNPDQTLQRYYEVPVDVLDDAGELERWAADAVRVGATSPTGGKRRPKIETMKR